MKALLAMAVLLACETQDVMGQEIDPHTVPIPELLSRFLEEQSVRNADAAGDAISRILTYGWRSPDDNDALISGLASLARDGETSLIKAKAVVLLIGAAGGTTARSPSPRVAPIVLSIFEDVHDPVVRGSIISMLGYLADRPVAVRILRRVLTEEPPAYAAEPAMEARSAVSSALGAGAPGLALLRELHAAGTIRDGSARAMVAELSASGRLRGGGLDKRPR